MSDRRQRNRDRTSRAIVNAALELFTELGFDATTVEQIATRAEVSPVTVFRYFGSKDAILFATLEDEAARLRAIVRALEPGGDLRATVVAALLSFARDMSTEQQQYAQRSRIISGSPTLQRAALATRVGLETALAEEVAALSEEHGSDSLAVRTVAGAGLTALHMAVRDWRERAEQGEPLEASVRKALQTLWPDLV